MTTRKLPLVLLLMMVIVSAGSLIQLQPVSATFPGANGKIVFTRLIGAPQTQIFTVNPDGSGLTQLTFTGNNGNPRWSADGTKIVFASDRTGRLAIWVMNADGSGQNQITHPPVSTSNLEPAFSPDGSKIVFVNMTASPTRTLWVTNIDGTNQKQLTAEPHFDHNPVWSPDGSKIVFWRQLPLNHIFIMNPDGSGQTDITQFQAPTTDDDTPEWSPDGHLIAFSNGPSGAIWVMNPDGSGRTKLTNPTYPLLDGLPAWSPDGIKIAFIRLILSGGERSLFVMNADGSNPTDISPSPVDRNDLPNWQPLRMGAVGGLVMPTSKFEIVAPFAALAGLIVAVSAVVAVKKRRD